MRVFQHDLLLHTSEEPSAGAEHDGPHVHCDLIDPAQRERPPAHLAGGDRHRTLSGRLLRLGDGGGDTQAVARGLSNAEIAAALHLSPYTVRDHLKAVFATVGVASRGELVAKLFADHYEPTIHAPGAATHAAF